jgi:hypothetical protein
MQTDLMKLSNSLFELSRDCPKEYETVLIEASIALMKINTATEAHYAVN